MCHAPGATSREAGAWRGMRPSMEPCLGGADFKPCGAQAPSGPSVCRTHWKTGSDGFLPSPGSCWRNKRAAGAPVPWPCWSCRCLRVGSNCYSFSLGKGHRACQAHTGGMGHWQTAAASASHVGEGCAACCPTLPAPASPKSPSIPSYQSLLWSWPGRSQSAYEAQQALLLSRSLGLAQEPEPPATSQPAREGESKGRQRFHILCF